MAVIAWLHLQPRGEYNSDLSNTANYNYLANSPLVSQIVFKQNSATRMTTSKAYDYLNRLTQIRAILILTTALKKINY
jgi:hypothetical protein